MGLKDKFNKLKKLKPYIPRFKITLKVKKITLTYDILWIIGLIVIFVSYMGFVYDTIERTIPFSAQGFIYERNLGDQFILEGIVAAIFLFLGALGLFFLYMGTRYLYVRNRALFYFGLGMTFIIISVVIIYWMFTLKLPENYLALQ